MMTDCNRNYIAGEPDLLAQTLLETSESLSKVHHHLTYHRVIELPSKNPIYVGVLDLQMDSIRISLAGIEQLMNAIDLVHIKQTVKPDTNDVS